MLNLSWPNVSTIVLEVESSIQCFAKLKLLIFLLFKWNGIQNRIS